MRQAHSNTYSFPKHENTRIFVSCCFFPRHDLGAVINSLLSFLVFHFGLAWGSGFGLAFDFSGSGSGSGSGYGQEAKINTWQRAKAGTGTGQRDKPINKPPSYKFSVAFDAAICGPMDQKRGNILNRTWAVGVAYFVETVLIRPLKYPQETIHFPSVRFPNLYISSLLYNFILYNNWYFTLKK